MSTTEEQQDKLLGAMLGHVMRGKETVSFEQLSKDLDFMERTKSWRKSWKNLLNEKGFIELSDGKSEFKSGCRMTQAGKDHAATPEYLEFMKELNFVPKTNEEHQARIKKRLLNSQAMDIFDLLLKHGPLSRLELSAILKYNDRTHKFSYGLQDLKNKDLLESCEDGKKKKFVLSDQAFLSPDDRPKTINVNPKVIDEGIRAIESRKRSAGTIPNEPKEGKRSRRKVSKKEVDVKADVEDGQEVIKDESEQKASKKKAVKVEVEVTEEQQRTMT